MAAANKLHTNIGQIPPIDDPAQTSAASKALSHVIQQFVVDLGHIPFPPEMAGDVRGVIAAWSQIQSACDALTVGTTGPTQRNLLEGQISAGFAQVRTAQNLVIADLGLPTPNG
jgi:hypothetical protein